jgi:hypothetical protein
LHVRIGGNLEGTTQVRINLHGVTIDVPVIVGPPTIMQMWIEPATVTTQVGDFLQVRAMALDTIFEVREVTSGSRWAVRDGSVAQLDVEGGMMLFATQEGHTTLHATNGEHAMVVPIKIYK